MNTNLAYDDWAEKAREELIDGQVVAMSPSPAWNHMAVSGNIYRIFSNYLDEKKCTPIQDGFDLFLTDKDRFIPDFMVVCDPDKIKAHGVYGAPDLVVEVLSPSTMRNDKTRKKDVYAQCGVREYWLVDTTNRSIEQYFLEDGQFVLQDTHVFYADWELEQISEQERAAVETHFKCSLFDDLDISLRKIFSRTL